VIVEVENKDLALLPGMTADVRVQVAQTANALRVPSSALRFRPELVGLNGQESAGPNGGGGRPAGSANGKGASAPRVARVYLPPERPGEALKAVDFQPGLTDGQYVEVREGAITEGEKIVVGLATSQGQDIGGLAGMARRH
jgi:HlyD family secretion protein